MPPLARPAPWPRGDAVRRHRTVLHHHPTVPHRHRTVLHHPPTRLLHPPTVPHHHRTILQRTTRVVLQ
jgi:hypothetical protein